MKIEIRLFMTNGTMYYDEVTAENEEKALELAHKKADKLLNDLQEYYYYGNAIDLEEIRFTEIEEE